MFCFFSCCCLVLLSRVVSCCDILFCCVVLWQVGVLGSNVHSIVMSSNNMVGQLSDGIATLQVRAGGD